MALRTIYKMVKYDLSLYEELKLRGFCIRHAIIYRNSFQFALSADMKGKYDVFNSLLFVRPSCIAELEK